MIYQYEWSAEPAKLTSNGQEHVAKIAHALVQTPCPVIVETSEDRATDELRRAAVLNALAAAGCAADPARVVCGQPESEGLYGQEAAGIAGSMLINQGSGQGGAGFGASSGASQGGGGSGGIGASSGGGSGGGLGVY